MTGDRIGEGNIRHEVTRPLPYDFRSRQSVAPRPAQQKNSRVESVRFRSPEGVYSFSSDDHEHGTSLEMRFQMLRFEMNHDEKRMNKGIMPACGQSCSDCLTRGKGICAEGPVVLLSVPPRRGCAAGIILERGQPAARLLQSQA